MPVIERIAPAQWRAAPWGDRQGIAHEVARWGDDPVPLARVSVADVVASGRFTSMPGRRRWLYVLDDGGGLALTIDGVRRGLVTGGALAFAGDAEVTAAIAGPARVWNLIVRDDVEHATHVALAATTLGVRAGVCAIFAPVAGTAIVDGQPYPLAADDTLVVASSHPAVVAVAAADAVAMIIVELGLAPPGTRAAAMVAPPSQTVVALDGAAMTSWPAMHDELTRALGFPGYYGRNLDALIDCLSSLDDPRDGLSTVHAAPGGIVVLAIAGARAMPDEIYAALTAAVAFVNFRVREQGGRALVAIAADR